jgi:hypothetical protein
VIPHGEDGPGPLRCELVKVNGYYAAVAAAVADVEDIFLESLQDEKAQSKLVGLL